MFGNPDFRIGRRFKSHLLWSTPGEKIPNSLEFKPVYQLRNRRFSIKACQLFYPANHVSFNILLVFRFCSGVHSVCWYSSYRRNKVKGRYIHNLWSNPCSENCFDPEEPTGLMLEKQTCLLVPSVYNIVNITLRNAAPIRICRCTRNRTGPHTIQTLPNPRYRQNTSTFQIISSNWDHLRTRFQKKKKKKKLHL